MDNKTKREVSVTNDNPLRTVIISNIITVLLSISASYVALKGQDKSTDASIYQATIERMNAQDQMISRLRISQTQADLRIIELEAEISKSGNHSDILRSYINGLDTPAWVKKRDKYGEFTMYIINDAYTEEYGKSRYVYEGSSDTDIWSGDLVKAWRDNDERAFSSGRTIRVTEQVVNSKGVTVEVEVWKFSIELPTGEQGVAGFVINTIDAERVE